MLNLLRDLTNQDYVCVCVRVGQTRYSDNKVSFFLSKMMKNLIQKLIAALCFVSKWLIPLEASFFFKFRLATTL